MLHVNLHVHVRKSCVLHATLHATLHETFDRAMLLGILACIQTTPGSAPEGPGRSSAFEVDGTVNLNCDLTNEPFDQPIKSNFGLIVKFGSEYNDDNEEILIVPHGEFKINVAHYIYELIVLSVPQKRLHPGIKDGTLNSEILETLEDLSPKSLDNKNSDKGIDPRWDSLKKLLTDK